MCCKIFKFKDKISIKDLKDYENDVKIKFLDSLYVFYLMFRIFDLIINYVYFFVLYFKKIVLNIVK